MAIAVEPPLVHISINGEMHGSVTQNGFHFAKRVGAAGFGDIITECKGLLTDFTGIVLPTVRTFASDDWHVKSTLLTCLNPREACLLENRIPTGEGFQPDEALPSFCSGLLSLRTGLGGRSHHGRLYFPGVAEAASENSRLVGEHLTNLSNIGFTILSRYGGAGTNVKWLYGMYSRRLGVVRDPGPPPILNWFMQGFFEVNETIPRVELATIRKRKLFVGE
jgi:hypothetical protein